MKPTFKEIMARAMILKCVVVHALSTPPKDMLIECFKKWSKADCEKFDEECKSKAESIIAKLKTMNLWSYVSPKEQLFLNSYGSHMNKYEHLAANWRIECVGMLMWALNLMDSWPPIDYETSSEVLKGIEIVDFNQIHGVTPMRSYEEIQPKRDLIELWHWRVRTEQLIKGGR